MEVSDPALFPPTLLGRQDVPARLKQPNKDQASPEYQDCSSRGTVAAEERPVRSSRRFVGLDVQDGLLPEIKKKTT
ncbi:UNVERIFIED_CONTAM: hypothetical protein NCL1_55329 [Trichonephila clavipes]